MSFFCLDSEEWAGLASTARRLRDSWKRSPCAGGHPMWNDIDEVRERIAAQQAEATEFRLRQGIMLTRARASREQVVLARRELASAIAGSRAMRGHFRGNQNPSPPSPEPNPWLQALRGLTP